MTDSHDPDDVGADEPLLEPEDELALGRALRAAYAPDALDPARHRALLAAALEDPFAPASEEEVRESERLRNALETGDETHAGAALARALAAAAEPKPLARAQASRVTERALGRRPNVVYVVFGSAALAAAAAFALLVASPRLDKAASTPVLAPVLARSQSTSQLFHERFEPGQASARIDRIASARERSFRENQYALWGVR